LPFGRAVPRQPCAQDQWEVRGQHDQRQLPRVFEHDNKHTHHNRNRLDRLGDGSGQSIRDHLGVRPKTRQNVTCAVIIKELDVLADDRVVELLAETETECLTGNCEHVISNKRCDSCRHDDHNEFPYVLVDFVVIALSERRDGLSNKVREQEVRQTSEEHERHAEQ
jgi:hypothetical protein